MGVRSKAVQEGDVPLVVVRALIDGIDPTLSMEELGALGVVHLEVENMGRFVLNAYLAPAGHDGLEGCDTLFIQASRMGKAGELESPVDMGPSEDGEGEPEVLIGFKPRWGVLKSHPNQAGKTYCPRDLCDGGLQTEAVGTICPVCQRRWETGEPMPDPYAGLKKSKRSGGKPKR